MAMRADYIWMNGEIIPWDEAQRHRLSSWLLVASVVTIALVLALFALAPALVLGAVLGNGFGQLLGEGGLGLPVAEPPAYAMVGMAAMVGAATGDPVVRSPAGACRASRRSWSATPASPPTCPVSPAAPPWSSPPASSPR